MSMLCFGCLRCPQVAKKSILGHMSTERFLLLLLLLFIFLSASNFFPIVPNKETALCVMHYDMRLLGEKAPASSAFF